MDYEFGEPFFQEAQPQYLLPTEVTDRFNLMDRIRKAARSGFAFADRDTTEEPWRDAVRWQNSQFIEISGSEPYGITLTTRDIIDMLEGEQHAEMRSYTLYAEGNADVATYREAGSSRDQELKWRGNGQGSRNCVAAPGFTAGIRRLVAAKTSNQPAPCYPRLVEPSEAR